MKCNAFLSVAVLGLSLFGPAHAASNLVANGSFELGDAGIGSFSGWQTQLGDSASFVDSSGLSGAHAGQASDGLWSAYFGSTAASGGATISQTLATTAGQTYTLSFDLANDNAGQPAANAFSAGIGNARPIVLTDIASQDYASESLRFTATGSSSRLSFFASNDTGYLQLDRVAVAAVPEPATASMALVALLALGLGLARRHRL